MAGKLGVRSWGAVMKRRLIGAQTRRAWVLWPGYTGPYFLSSGASPGSCFSWLTVCPLLSQVKNEGSDGVDRSREQASWCEVWGEENEVHLLTLWVSDPVGCRY